jgi:hypothetical protein
MNIIPSAKLVEEVKRRRVHPDLHVGISHRSYLRNDGGIEHCLRRESEFARLAKVDYLHLCPPEVVVHGRRLPPLVEVCLNDEFVGLSCLDGLSAKLGLLRPGVSFLHSALRFESDSLIRLLLNLRPFGPILQWIHDLSFACESVTLVRDGDACGVPELGASLCYGCRYERSRAAVMAHYDVIERLSDCQIFPSVTAKSRYNMSISSRARSNLRKQFVVPHYIVNGVPSASEGRHFRADNEQIGVAFFGHSVAHKGWTEYVQLVSALQGNSAYRFYHIGSAGQTDYRIERLDFSEVSAPAGSDLLRDICVSRNIKVAFFWPIALESFGIFLRQVLGVGCAVLSNNNNDALKEFINGCDQIRRFARLDELIAWFGDRDAVAALLRQAAEMTCVLEPSLCSDGLITNQNNTWQISNMETR